MTKKEPIEELTGRGEGKMNIKRKVGKKQTNERQA